MDGPGLVEVLAAWSLIGLDALAISRLYAGATTAPGLIRQGSGRAAALAQLRMLGRHPGLPVGLAILPIAVGRLPASRDQAIVVLGAGMLGGNIALAAKHIGGAQASDALAVGGIVAALGATAASAARADVGPLPGIKPGDSARLIVGGALVLNGLPWALADLGVYAGDLPGVGRVVLSRQFVPAGATWPAVHLGHHHGLDGTILALTALLLSRPLPELRPGPVRDALSLGLAIMLVYGVMRAAEDGWNEQVVKRGWTTWKVPLIVSRGRARQPRVWAGMAVAAVALHAGWRQNRATAAP